MRDGGRRGKETEQMFSLIKSLSFASPPALEWQLASNRPGTSSTHNARFQILSRTSVSSEDLNCATSKSSIKSVLESVKKPSVCVWGGVWGTYLFTHEYITYVGICVCIYT